MFDKAKLEAVRDRFYAKTARNNGCLEWTCSVNSKGRARFYFDGRTRMASRVVWEMERHPIPEGLWVLHKCDNPKCVDIDHLFLGTPRDNVLDMFAKGRKSKEQRKNQNSGVTHCKRGHPLSGDNLVGCGVPRSCKECSNMRNRAYRARLAMKEPTHA